MTFLITTILLVILLLSGITLIASTVRSQAIDKIISGRTLAQAELQTLAHNIELPSPKVVLGISNPADLSYIRRKAPRLRGSLVRERRRLARQWLRENRVQLQQLLRLHRLIGRTSEDLKVSVEFQVAGSYLWLQTMLLAAEAVVIIAGPFHARTIGLTTMGAFNHLSSAIAKTVATLDAGKKAAIRTNWAQASDGAAS